eukprot:TRINITY_DN3128_c0_g2_i1.p1 TRINITY_DN3128_c0_g2~~TRINITY_DN3128_c0_g2_i1.p1  ORF type:complete len:587 (-),score=97.71 TRINITY_DN3128_c0_g2_i1:66-1772(-)
MKNTLLLILITFFITIQCTAIYAEPASLEELFYKYENITKTIATKIEAAVFNPPTSYSSIVDVELSKYPSKLCYSSPIPYSDCITDSSTVCSSSNKYAPQTRTVSTYVYKSNEGTEAKNDEIVTSVADSIWVQLYEEESDWFLESIQLNYISTRTRFVRNFPGQIFLPFKNTSTTCYGLPSTYDNYYYDPRSRPYFYGPATGPLRIILLVDVSKKEHFNRTIKLVEATITAFPTNYLVGLMTFNQANIYQNTLGNATDEWKAELITYVKSLNTKFDTGITYSPFKYALKALASSSTTNNNLNIAPKIIYFLSNGGPSVSAETVYRSFADETLYNYEPISLFGVAMTSESPIGLLKYISCKTRAMFVDASDYLYETISFDIVDPIFEILTINSISDNAMYSETYVSVLTGSDTATVSFPIYKTNVSPKRFLGVVALDFDFSVIEQKFDSSDLLNYVTTKRNTNTDSANAISYRDCVLEPYRDGNKCNTCERDRDYYSVVFVVVLACVFVFFISICVFKTKSSLIPSSNIDINPVVFPNPQPEPLELMTILDKALEDNMEDNELSVLTSI